MTTEEREGKRAFFFFFYRVSIHHVIINDPVSCENRGTQLIQHPRCAIV